jgi:hypothetical protein
MKYLQVINNGFDKNLVLDKVGRLNYEFGANRKDTLAKVAGDIHKAALVMGISIDGEKSVLTASEALKKIVEVYPTAWVADVSKAIEMASFGQIKLENQLNTISAANIFQWYRELRLNHPDKIGDPMETTYNEPKPVSPEEKFKIMLDAFVAFLEEPKKNELASVVYYDRLAGLGLIDISAEAKTKKTIQQILRLLRDYPIDILNDRLKRKQANEFRQYFNELEEPKTVHWAVWAENPIVTTAIAEVKRRLVLDCLDFYEKEEIISNYKTQIANELQITVQ